MKNFKTPKNLLKLVFSFCLTVNFAFSAYSLISPKQKQKILPKIQNISENVSTLNLKNLDLSSLNREFADIVKGVVKLNPKKCLRFVKSSNFGPLKNKNPKLYNALLTRAKIVLSVYLKISNRFNRYLKDYDIEPVLFMRAELLEIMAIKSFRNTEYTLRSGQKIGFAHIRTIKNWFELYLDDYLKPDFRNLYKKVVLGWDTVKNTELCDINKYYEEDEPKACTMTLKEKMTSPEIKKYKNFNLSERIKKLNSVLFKNIQDIYAGPAEINYRGFVALNNCQLWQLLSNDKLSKQKDIKLPIFLTKENKTAFKVLLKKYKILVEIKEESRKESMIHNAKKIKLRLLPKLKTFSKLPLNDRYTKTERLFRMERYFYGEVFTDIFKQNSVFKGDISKYRKIELEIIKIILQEMDKTEIDRTILKRMNKFKCSKNCTFRKIKLGGKINWISANKIIMDTFLNSYKDKLMPQVLDKYSLQNRENFLKLISKIVAIGPYMHENQHNIYFKQSIEEELLPVSTFEEELLAYTWEYSSEVYKFKTDINFRRFYFPTMSPFGKSIFMAFNHSFYKFSAEFKSKYPNLPTMENFLKTAKKKIIQKQMKYTDLLINDRKAYNKLERTGWSIPFDRKTYYNWYIHNLDGIKPSALKTLYIQFVQNKDKYLKFRDKKLKEAKELREKVLKIKPIIRSEEDKKILKELGLL